MIVEKALKLAGPGAHLVRRPGGRIHVYTGRLTRSGRFVPARGRVLCRAYTRRLQVVDELPSTLQRRASEAGVCARCSARLLPRGRAEQRPSTRAAFLDAYDGTSKADLAFALTMARTPAEVDAAAHLTLALFDVAGTLVPFTDHGREFAPLHRHVLVARGRVHGFPDSLYQSRERAAALSAAGRELAIARRKEARADREARIERLGLTNATRSTR